MHTMIQAMRELSIAFADPDAERHVQLLRGMRADSGVCVWGGGGGGGGGEGEEGEGEGE